MAVEEIIRNKKYKIIVAIGYNGNKRIRHIETFEGLKSEAILRENEIKIQLKNNTFIAKNKMTMEQIINKWLEYSETKLSPKTMVSYKLYAKNVIKCIGHIKLQNINTKILEEFYQELRTNTTYSDKTIQHHYTLISTVLNKAIVWGYISNNPNSKIEKPKVKKKEIQCYTPEQVDLLVQALQEECLKYKALILLALDSGCRRGEITGLTWEDVDFKKGTINVNKSTQYISGRGIIEKSTKTDTSNRLIYISETTIDILKQYKKEQLKIKEELADIWQNSKRVFTTELGGDMHPDTPSDIFKRILKRHKLSIISFHALRHTSISLQIASGIQAQIISKRAGHSNLSVTHNTYSHFFENGFKDVANRMNAMLAVKS